MNQSESLAKLAPALVKAQAEMGVALKDSTNPHFRSRYADLTSIITASRDALTKNGLAVLQRPKPNPAGVEIETTIVHSSGEWISDDGLFLPAAKVDPQGFGSAMTYARRYGLAAMLQVVQDDDDGNAASATPQQAPRTADAGVSAVQAAFDATPAPAEGEYVFAFGKHKDKPISAVDDGYLKYLLAQPPKDPKYAAKHAEQHAIYRAELEKRGVAA